MITNHLDYRYAAHMALKLLKIEFWPYHSKLRYCRFESDLKIGDQLLYMRRPNSKNPSEFTPEECKQIAPFFLMQTKGEMPSRLWRAAYYPSNYRISTFGVRIGDVYSLREPGHHATSVRSRVSYPKKWAYADRKKPHDRTDFCESKWIDAWDKEDTYWRCNRALTVNRECPGVVGKVNADLEAIGQKDTYNLLRALLPQFSQRPFVHKTIEKLVNSGFLE